MFFQRNEFLESCKGAALLHTCISTLLCLVFFNIETKSPDYEFPVIKWYFFHSSKITHQWPLIFLQKWDIYVGSRPFWLFYFSNLAHHLAIFNIKTHVCMWKMVLPWAVDSDLLRFLLNRFSHSTCTFQSQIHLFKVPYFNTTTVIFSM